MQEPDLSKRDAFIWSFEDELIQSPFVRISPDDNNYCGEMDPPPSRFTWHLSGFKLRAIRELKSKRFIPLFEAALLIGDRLQDAMHWFINDAPLIFAIAFEQGEIDPREPKCHMSYSKIQHIPEWEECVINGRFKAPDATWLITPKEAAEFAILKGYPEHLFTDLLSGTPATATKAESSRDFTDSEWKSKNEREFLYRTIGALVLLLIERTQSEKFGTRERPNKKAIYEAAIQLLDDMGFKTEGQTKTNLNDVFKDALDVTMK